MNPMRKTVTAATVVASLAAGGLAGTVLGAPVAAGAAETATGAVGWVQETLAGLVRDQTLTQAQADAVETALRDARPARPGRHGHGFRHGGHPVVDAVLETLGITGPELRAALRSGKTIRDVAAERGVAVTDVVAAIVAAERAHLAEHVAAGDLTQAEADDRLADAEERASALVDGEGPKRGPGRFGGGPRRGATPGDGSTSTTAA